METGGLHVQLAKHDEAFSNSSKPKVEEPSADVVDGHGHSRIREGVSTDASSEINNFSNDDGLQVICFTDVLDDVTLHFQIIRLHKQIYAWIGSNSAKFGHLYAAAPTRPNNKISVTNLLGGASDNTGTGIAHRLVLKTGLNVILACNIPKNNPTVEADAEKKLVQKLISLGYTRPKFTGSST
ncbi:hypothetical protein NMG60_11024915 [Bertholletia excelsa]